MAEKGNWGELSTTEVPEKRTLLGVPIETYPNEWAKKNNKYEYVNWFDLDGTTFRWVKDSHARIPKHPDNPTSKLTKEADGWEEFLIAVAELFYGAIYDKNSQKLIERPDIAGMNHKQMFAHMQNMSGMGRNLRGWGKNTLETTISLIKKLKLLKTKDDVVVTPSETDKEKDARQKKEELRTNIVARDFFMDKDESVQFYKKRAYQQGNVSRSKINTNLSNLYNFLLVTGFTAYPEHYTRGYKEMNDDEKAIDLKRDMTRYKQFVKTYDTPKSWWEKMSNIGFTPELEYYITDEESDLGKGILVVASNEFTGENIKFNVTVKQIDNSNFKNRWQKVQQEFQWEEGDTGDNQRKSATDAIRSWIQYGGDPDQHANWKLSDQTPSSVLSSSVMEAPAPHLGREVTDKEMMAGLKFLETGARWVWEDSGTFEKMTTMVDGKERTADVPIQHLVKDVTDTDPHYNTTLPIYEKWGSPYGELAPANMFVRIALSGTGWRKAEALTCRNAEIVESKKEKEKSGFYFTPPKIEGDPEVLQLVFQTRKTERLGKKQRQHTSSIPPVSNDLINSKHTISLIMAKNNQFRYESNESFVRVPIPDKERKENRQAKQYGKKWKRAEGQVAKTLIGFDNQFLPVDTITTKLGADLIFNGKQLTAYLYTPLKEMYAQMIHTKVSVRDEETIKKMRKKAVDKQKQFSKNPNKVDDTIYPMDAHKWSQSPNKNAPHKNEAGRFSQDKFRWEDPEDYWIKRPLHSVRHIFAQIWLRKSEWNFGLVAMFGHWKIIDTLKENYGERDNDTALKQMIGLFAKSEDIHKTRQKEAKLRNILRIEDAENLKQGSESDKTRAEIIKADSEGEA